MLRFFVLLLVLANGGYFAWSQGYLAGVGFAPTPHMFFYHVNLGAPLLAEGARYLAPIADVVWAAGSNDVVRIEPRAD